MDKEGSFGIWGHAAIVEGHYYSTTYRRDSYLYRVKDATSSQKTAAVNFCVGQIGKPWALNLLHDYSSSVSSWLCSQLVWAGYKNQGIDIECNGGPGGDPGVTPKDITINSTKATETNIRIGYTSKLVTGKFKSTSIMDTAIFVDKGNNQTALKVRYGSSATATQAWISNVGGFVYSDIINIVAGDFNGDGYDDIAVFYQNSASMTTIYMWNGSSSGLNLYGKNGNDYVWRGANFPAIGIVKIISGDFTSDAKRDIALIYNQGGTETSIFMWKGTSTSLELNSSNSNGSIWHGSNFNSSGIRNIVAGNFSDTAKWDIALFYDHGSNSTSIFEWKGSASGLGLINSNPNGSVWQSSTFSASRLSGRVVAGKFNSDSYCDIAAFYDQGSKKTTLFEWRGQAVGFTSNGGNGVWDSKVGAFDATCISNKVVAGNFNNSTYDDVAAIYSSGSSLLLFEWKGSNSQLTFNTTLSSRIVFN